MAQALFLSARGEEVLPWPVPPLVYGGLLKDEGGKSCLD